MKLLLSMQTAMMDDLNTIDRIVMSGNGRCDSPGRVFVDHRLIGQLQRVEQHH